MAQNVQAGDQIQIRPIPVLCGRCPNRRVVTRVGADDNGIVWVAYSPHPRWRVHARRGGGGTVWGWGGNDRGGAGHGWAPLEPTQQTPSMPITLTMKGCRQHPRAVRLDRLVRVLAEAERAGRRELVTFVDL